MHGDAALPAAPPLMDVHVPSSEVVGGALAVDVPEPPPVKQFCLSDAAVQAFACTAISAVQTEPQPCLADAAVQASVQSHDHAFQSDVFAGFSSVTVQAVNQPLVTEMAAQTAQPPSIGVDVEPGIVTASIV